MNPDGFEKIRVRGVIKYRSGQLRTSIAVVLDTRSATDHRPAPGLPVEQKSCDAIAPPLKESGFLTGGATGRDFLLCRPRLDVCWFAPPSVSKKDASRAEAEDGPASSADGLDATI